MKHYEANLNETVLEWSHLIGCPNEFRGVLTSFDVRSFDVRTRQNSSERAVGARIRIPNNTDCDRGPRSDEFRGVLTSFDVWGYDVRTRHNSSERAVGARITIPNNTDCDRGPRSDEY